MKKMIFSSVVGLAFSMSIIVLTTSYSFAGTGEKNSKSSSREIKRSGVDSEKTNKGISSEKAKSANEVVPDHLIRKIEFEQERLKHATDEKDIKTIKANIIYLEEMKASYNQEKQRTK